MLILSLLRHQHFNPLMFNSTRNRSHRWRMKFKKQLNSSFPKETTTTSEIPPKLLIEARILVRDDTTRFVCKERLACSLLFIVNSKAKILFQYHGTPSSPSEYAQMYNKNFALREHRCQFSLSIYFPLQNISLHGVLGFWGNLRMIFF